MTMRTFRTYGLLRDPMSFMGVGRPLPCSTLRFDFILEAAPIMAGRRDRSLRRRVTSPPQDASHAPHRAVAARWPLRRQARRLAPVALGVRLDALPGAR